MSSGARPSIDVIATTASVARAAVGAGQAAAHSTVHAASKVGRATTDVAGAAGRLTMEAAAAMGRASFDASAVAIALARWVAAQPFDKTPFAEDTILMLQLGGFVDSSDSGGLWLKSGAAARIVRLPHGLHSGPGESLEAVVAVTVTDSGMVHLAVCVPRTHFQWERAFPAATPAFAVPGLSINAFGWANLGLLISWSLSSAEPSGSGHALVVHLSIGASVYGLGKSGIPLYELPIPLTRITGLFKFARSPVGSPPMLKTTALPSQRPPQQLIRDGPGFRGLPVVTEPPHVALLVEGPCDLTASEVPPWASQPVHESVYFEQADGVGGQTAPSAALRAATVGSVPRL